MIIKPDIGNHPLWPLEKSKNPVPLYGSPNGWLHPRKYNIHTGVDLFAKLGEPVYAMYEGWIDNIGLFTGDRIFSPWWNETWYISVRHRPVAQMYCFIYGEIKPDKSLLSNGYVEAGQLLGTVQQVIKKPKVGQQPCMLHMEAYSDTHPAPIDLGLDKYDDMVQCLDWNGLMDPTDTLLRALELRKEYDQKF